MKLTVHLAVKFRALGITFWNIDKTFERTLPAPPQSRGKQTVLTYTDRGVLLEVWVE
ncbi:MAG: hypothetical protein M3315_01135 [Actinomycetota bacterium]|nr:hypothetical protein [Actinomycetota bacterium]